MMVAFDFPSIWRQQPGPTPSRFTSENTGRESFQKEASVRRPGQVGGVHLEANREPPNWSKGCMVCRYPVLSRRNPGSIHAELD